MPVPTNPTFNQVTKWLDSNLEDLKRISADSSQTRFVPKTKGIYFWFMKESCYSQLSSLISITPIEKRVSKTIDGEKYDLVYIGTAGVRRNKNGINNGHLQQRLKWHLKDNQTINTFCKGSMSTFRRTIGPLLGNDLFEKNMQDRIDQLLSENFIVYWTEYPGSFIEVVEVVNQDEEILIQSIRPLFNLKKNPNADIVHTSTYKIQQKRLESESYNKAKYCDNNDSKPVKASKSNSPSSIKPGTIIKEIKGCMEFTVRNDQTVLDVIPNLPKANYEIEIFSNDPNDKRDYVNGKLRKTGRAIHDYFKSIDAHLGNVKRFRIIQMEMNNSDMPIEEITIRICISERSNSKKEKTTKQINTNHSADTTSTNFIDELIKRKPSITDKKNKKLLIINCCDAKSMQPINLNNAQHSNYAFGTALNNARRIRLADYQAMNADYFNTTRNNAPVNQAYFMGALNPSNRRPVFDTYGSNHSPFFNPHIKAIYLDKIQHSNLHILIISGLYGILHHSDYINDYHFEINKGINIWGNTISNAIQEFIIQNDVDNQHVVFCLSPKYQPYIGQPNANWENLWRNLGGRGHNQASELIEFLNQI